MTLHTCARRTGAPRPRGLQRQHVVDNSSPIAFGEPETVVGPVKASSTSVALVRAGAKFEKGVMVERSNLQDQEVAA